MTGASAIVLPLVAAEGGTQPVSLPFPVAKDLPRILSIAVTWAIDLKGGERKGHEEGGVSLSVMGW